MVGRGTRPAPGKFLSTLPARGATLELVYLLYYNVPFLSTLPARGATIMSLKQRWKNDISIHAPREGSDGADHRRVVHLRTISIHAPREGSDRLPAAQNAHPDHFYPRSPRGERHQ